MIMNTGCFFFVEGNIAAGKSTFLDNIADIVQNLLGRPCIVIKEPVDAWVAPLTPSGDGILQLYYADKTRYGVAFQATVLISRLTQLQKVIHDNPGAIIIAERSPSSAQMFARQMASEGIIDETIVALHDAWVAMVETVIGSAGTIYLRVSPDVCMQRLNMRGRRGEDGIQRKLLEDLHSLHDAHIEGLQQRSHPVLTLDGNLSMDSTSEHIARLCSFIMQFAASSASSYE